MVRYTFDPANPPPLTREQIARLEKLRDLPDDQIDFSDIPPSTPEQLARAIRNPFLYPPVRLSADVVEYFQDKVGPDRSIVMDVNHVLLDYIAREKKKAAKKAG